MATRLNDLLQREVDRKQFLIESSLAVLSLVGLGGIIRLLSSSEPRTSGYGASSYGGSTDNHR
jgi:hypothetical protein